MNPHKTKSRQILSHDRQNVIHDETLTFLTGSRVLRRPETVIRDDRLSFEAGDKRATGLLATGPVQLP